MVFNPFHDIHFPLLGQLALAIYHNQLRIICFHLLSTHVLSTSFSEMLNLHIEEPDVYR